MYQNHPEEVNATESPVEAAHPEGRTVPGSFQTGDRPDQADAAVSSRTPRIQKRWEERLKVGEHVSFIAEGIKGSGIIDAVMPDNSVIWIWADAGLGRRMLHPGTGTSIHPKRPVLEGR
jgi:hypothetical protein